MCNCGQQKCFCSLLNVISNAKDSELAVLCTSEGVPVIVQYIFSDANPEGATGIVYMAWNVNGTPFEGNVADLVACSGGGGGGGLAFATYPICDNGTFKFVNLCGSDCGQINITYTNLNRTPADAPADWGLVTYGPCGGGGGGSSFWTQTLCYVENIPEGSQVLYRENNAFSGNVGTYLPYTWSPNAPLSDPAFGVVPSFVHGPDPVVLKGNDCFDATFGNLYSFYNTQIMVVSFSDPANPIIISGPTAIPTTASGERVLSMWTSPTSGITYAIIRYTGEGNATFLFTIVPATGLYTYVAGSLGSSTNQWVIAIDIGGNGYVFKDDGGCYSLNLATGNTTALLWTCDPFEYVYAFMGHASGTDYGVCIYNTNTGVYTNKKINLLTGAVSDTLTGTKRGIFYVPSTTPVNSTKFTRQFCAGCGESPTVTNRDFVTGEIIVIPEGATVRDCS